MPVTSRFLSYNVEKFINFFCNGSHARSFLERFDAGMLGLLRYITPLHSVKQVPAHTLAGIFLWMAKTANRDYMKIPLPNDPDS